MKLRRGVIDTNVLYAGLYSSLGASFQLLRRIESGCLIPVLSTAILFEYEEVLRRNQKILQLSSRGINDVLDDLCLRRISTVVCVPLTSNTSNMKWAEAPGNVLLKSSLTGLPKDSVANVSLIVALDRNQLTERVGKLTQRHMTAIINGINVLLGR